MAKTRGDFSYIRGQSGAGNDQLEEAVRLSDRPARNFKMLS